MNSKRSQKSSIDEETPEPQSDPWSELEAQVAERNAQAVRSARRSDSEIRAANAHLDPGEVT
jgi:hypothetical protein